MPPRLGLDLLNMVRPQPGGMTTQQPQIAPPTQRMGGAPRPPSVGAAGRTFPALDVVAGPGTIAGTTNDLMKLFMSSPAFAQMMKAAMGTASRTNTALQGAAGRTGMSSTGIGALTSGLGSQLAGNAAQSVRADAFQQALQTAMQSILGRLNVLPNMTQLYMQ